jgi:hypothetical protein
VLGVEVGVVLQGSGLDLVFHGDGVGIVGDGDVGDVERKLRVADVHDGYLGGMIDSGGMTEHGVHDAEDGGIGSNAEGQGKDGGEGESRLTKELAKRVAKVAEEHERGSPYFASTGVSAGWFQRAAFY